MNAIFPVIYDSEVSKEADFSLVPQEVREMFTASDKYFPTQIQKFQFYDKYARYNYDLGRRETWIETVKRSVDYLRELSKNKLSEEDYQRIERFILEMKAAPSMRLLAMAGEAARRSNIAIYNCSFLPMDSIDSFVEELIIAMAGCGVGFSVEKQYVDQLPKVRRQLLEAWIPRVPFVVEDSTEGWARALKLGLTAWFAGQDIEFDYSEIRAAGTPLRIKGGRACLTGDTVLYKDRKKSREENTLTIQELFAIKNEAKAGRFERIKLRCLDEETGVFYRNRVVDVIDNGIAEVFEVTTQKGYKIKATANHRFMNNMRGYQELSNFAIGDLIAVNGKELKTKKCMDCDTFISRRATRCRDCQDKNQIQENVLLTTARQRKQCRDYAKENCELCERSDVRMEIHHIDHNPLNNDWSNLINLCSPCHQQLHAVERNYGDPYKQKYVTFERIASILSVGEEQVFDLQMSAPNHNFVANGFVSHNSGSEPFQSLLEFARKVILGRQGTKLRPIDAHDIACKIGECIVSGGVRRCLPGDTRIHTKRGAIPITEVKIGDMVMTESGYKKVVDWVEQGKQDIVEIHTESGTIFRCTPTHRIAVLSDSFGNYVFKRADELEENDRMLFITHSIEGENHELLPLPSKRQADHSGSHLKQPILDKETAWILGYFFANGYVQITDHTEKGKKGNTQVAFSCPVNKTDIHEKILQWFESLGIKENIVKQDGNWINIRSGNRQLARWFYQYKQANTPLVIPECIWRGTQEIRASFLSGVVDGCYSDRPFTVVSTVYPQFASDLVKLLATLGIIAEFRTRRKAVGNWKELFTVTVKNDLALQKIRELVASLPIHDRKRQSGYTIPGSFVKRDISKKEYCKWDKRGDMNATAVSDITKKNFFIPVKVVDVVSLAKQEETYDISVQDQHVFVAEGYLVHNTALISLFDYDDKEMQNCKNGDRILGNEQRYMANNSAVWPENVTDEQITVQMQEMRDGMRGEPGIFSRTNANRLRPDRRKAATFGTNPCGEINLRPYEFCNLSIAIARADDNEATLREKVEVAAIIGTIQSMATHFPGLRDIWKKNCEEERLLGVDINGWRDTKILANSNPDLPGILERLKNHAVTTNKRYAEILEIPQSVAVTCVKPSGNSGILFNCASGLHGRWAPYYVRRVRIQAASPLRRVMEEQGVPMVPENGQEYETATTFVASFPLKSPEGTPTRNDASAIQQCEYWLLAKKHWTEHNPSVTITYRPEEFEELLRWVIEHKSWIGGMSFLPASDAQYSLMPNEEISREEYESLSATFPNIDFSYLWLYEQNDMTTSSQEIACSSGQCDIADYYAAKNTPLTP